MNSKAVLAAVMAMSMMTGDFAFAQGNSRQGDRDRGDQGQRGDRGDNDRGRHDNDRGRNDNDRGRNDGARPGEHGRERAREVQRNRDYRQAHRDDDRRGRGAGPNHNFYRGERISTEYRHRNYVVDDWRGHQLSAPPRGYHWVQAGGDYVLIAIATGIISQIFLGR